MKIIFTVVDDGTMFKNIVTISSMTVLLSILSVPPLGLYGYQLIYLLFLPGLLVINLPLLLPKFICHCIFNFLRSVLGHIIYDVTRTRSVFHFSP